jgi:hypothetical protein
MGPFREVQMRDFFSSGHAVDIVLAVLAVETLGLLVWSRRQPLNVLQPILPGVFLLLALRASLTNSGWIWIGLWMTLSLPAHLADLWRRLR